MKKEQFIEIMKELISIRKDEKNLNEAFKKFEPDFNYICFGRYETLLVKILQIAMKDKSDWIGYWLYECDCGENKLVNSVKDKDGKKIPIKKLSDLYNCITL